MREKRAENSFYLEVKYRWSTCKEEALKYEKNSFIFNNV